MLSRENIKDLIQVGCYLLGLCLVLQAAVSPHDADFYKRYDKANAIMFLAMSTIILWNWIRSDLKRSVALVVWALTLWNAKDFTMGTEKVLSIREFVFDIIVTVLFIINLIYIAWNYYKRRKA